MDQKTETEVWKAIPGGEGRYEVSSIGRVRSFLRNPNGALLKSAHVGRGYRMVCIALNGRAQTPMRVHHLVLMAFVGPRPEGMVGCHNNDIPDDNRVTNLRWDTPAGNTADRLARGYHSKNSNPRSNVGRPGEKNHNAKLTAAAVLQILSDPRLHRVIAAEHGVHNGVIARIKCGEAWTHVTRRAATPD